MRYTGPVTKRSRHLGYSILESGKEFSKGKRREYEPGQHGKKDQKRKRSEYGKQLLEKQKLKDIYGVNERQFRRLFMVALASNEVTGFAFIKLLESRLDNVVYRMGFAPTRKAARQLVNHGHILVNGKKVNIPSYVCSINDKISVREKSCNLAVIKKSLEAKSDFKWVNVDIEKRVGVLTRLPERSEIHKDIVESQIVEYYNRKL